MCELEPITIDIPKSWLHGCPIEAFMCCEFVGESVAGYVEGDKLLIRTEFQVDTEQTVAVMYRGCFMLGRVEYSNDEIIFYPLNADEDPLHIIGEAIGNFNIVGIPEVLIRDFKNEPLKTPFLRQ